MSEMNITLVMPSGGAPGAEGPARGEGGELMKETGET